MTKQAEILYHLLNDDDIMFTSLMEDYQIHPEWLIDEAVEAIEAMLALAED